MSLANRKTLSMLILRTRGRVGFACVWKLLRVFTKESQFRTGLKLRFPQPARDLEAFLFSEIRFARTKNDDHVGRSESVSAIIQRRKFFINAPVAQLDRAHGYEP